MARFRDWLLPTQKARVLPNCRGYTPFFDQKRYQLGEWVTMPNHVHAVVTPQPGFELTKILHSWKSYSATRINQLVNREGPLWQEESFNQILRNEQHLWRVEQYIRNNLIKAGIRVHHASFL